MLLVADYDRLRHDDLRLVAEAANPSLLTVFKDAFVESGKFGVAQLAVARTMNDVEKGKKAAAAGKVSFPSALNQLMSR